MKSNQATISQDVCKSISEVLFLGTFARRAIPGSRHDVSKIVNGVICQSVKTAGRCILHVLETDTRVIVLLGYE